MVMSERSWDQFQKNVPQKQINQEQREQEFRKSPAQAKTEEISKEPNSWGKFQTPSTYQPEADDEPTLDWLGRNIISHGFRAAEGAIGKYGDIQKFAQDQLSDKPYLGGLLGWGIQKLVGQDKWNQMIYGRNPEMLNASRLPTSSQLKQKTIDITGELTKPKNKWEKRSQEFAGDFGLNYRRGAGAANNIGIPFAANVAKSTMTELGFGDEKGDWGKMATWLTLSLSRNINGAAHASQLMNEGRNGIPGFVNANINRYQNRLNFASRGLLHNDPRTALARQQLAGIENDIANGRTSVGDLMNRYDALNAAKRDAGLYALNRADRGHALREINNVQAAVREEIQAASHQYPQALDAWNNGRQAWATIHQSRQMTNWVNNLLTGQYSKLLATPVAALFGGAGYGAFKAPLAGTATATIPPALYKTGQVAYRVWNSPTLANYYWHALQAQAEQNGPNFIKWFNKLNDAYEKEEKKSTVKPMNKSAQQAGAK